ncbi:unnamed protein product [Amoebophrya sp. A25]|nr:unnamed protein product [Amoebophrya sp. A25]|eukprot:GSA25T00009937001.1
MNRDISCSPGSGSREREACPRAKYVKKWGKNRCIYNWNFCSWIHDRPGGEAPKGGQGAPPVPSRSFVSPGGLGSRWKASRGGQGARCLLLVCMYPTDSRG